MNITAISWKIISYSMSVRPTDFNELNRYANHLIANPSLLDSLCEQYFQAVASSNIPLLEFYNTLPEEEVRKQCYASMRSMVTMCAEGNSAAAASQIIRNWQAGNYNHIPQNKVSLPDLLSTNRLRKSVLMYAATAYTTDVKQYAQLAQELDEFCSIQDKEALQTHLAQVQKALYKEKEFSASIINNSVNGVLAFDKKLTILEWNPVMEGLYGLEKEAVLGKKIFDVFSDYKDSEEGRAVLSVLRGEQVFISERSFFKGEGYYEASIIPLYTAEDSIAGGVVIIHETTHRKEAEEEISRKNRELAQALAELQTTSNELKKVNLELEQRVAERTQELIQREKFLNSIIEQSPTSTWITDAEGTLLQLNQASQKLFGIADASKVVGHYNILQDEALKQTPAHAQLEAVYKEEQAAELAISYDMRMASALLAQRAQPVSLIFSLFPVKDKSGRLMHVVVQHNDVTDVNKAEAARKNSEEQLQLITDAVPVLISYIDKDRKFKLVNLEYERWYQKKRADIVNRYMWEVLGEKPYARISYLIDKALSGERVQDEVYQDYGGSIGKKHISATLIPHIVRNEVVGLFAMVSDISDSKNNEQVLENLYEEARIRNEELNRINTDLDNFFYTASHDLKSPISNMEGLLSLISREIKPKLQEREGKLIDLLGNSVTKLKNTIEDLISITRKQKGIDGQGNEEVSFHEIVLDVKEDLKPLLEKSQPKIIENFKVESIFYARSHLRSIIYNLLSNALKYRFPNRQLVVELETEQEQDTILLRVKDNGLGMTPTQLNKLFSRFIRMHTHVEGTGIGLYTIKRIIENKGGSIAVSSEAAKGTAFTVYFRKVEE